MITLASNSPRRRELLAQMGFKFQVKASDIDETFPEDMPAHEVAEYLARQKARAMLPEATEHDIFIAADTTVIKDGNIFNKPFDAADAERIIGILSGGVHEVVTGVCVAGLNCFESFSVRTEVHFSPIPPAAIQHYVAHYQPFDKAGAYAIQEWIGLNFIHQIKGSYTNIVGLPTAELYTTLLKLGVQPTEKA